MIEPAIPADEAARAATLRGLQILDTEAEEAFDRVTRLAQRLFDVPIALVSLVDIDRQWFKSRAGLAVSETPRETSFCGHTILGDEIMVVADARQDERFEDNPLVMNDPNIRFYAGCPLRAVNGCKVGTLCLIDRAPRELSEEDSALLQDLAQMVEKNLAAVDLATTDELTGISNRRGFKLLADKAFKACRRFEQTATVVVFDLDGFKPINDQWGHAEGDNALRDFAAGLVKTFRESDVIGRLGGDEFGIFLGGSGKELLPGLLDRFNQNLIEKSERGARPYRLSYSRGSFSRRPDESTTLDEMLAQADSAMYRDKSEGRQRQRAAAD